MKRILLIVILLVLPSSANAERSVDEVIAFVLKGYQPVPVAEALDFPSAATPQLINMLKDDEFRDHWHNIVLTIGAIGDKGGAEALISHFERFEGKIDNRATFHSIALVPTALGYAAYKGEKTALDYLISCTSMDTLREKTTWHYRDRSNDQMVMMLFRLVIQALGISGSEEARVILNGLVREHEASDTPHGRLIEGSSRGALELREGIRRDGLKETLRRLRTRSSASVEPQGSSPEGGPRIVQEVPPDELIRKGVDEFNRIVEAFLRLPIEEVMLMLADDGKPFEQYGEEELEVAMGSLDREREGIELTKRITREILKLPPDYGQGEVEATPHGLLVRIPIRNSGGILPQLGVHPPDSLTRGKDGILQVIMIHSGDKWYWNPFGW